MEPLPFLRSLFETAVDAVSPRRVLPPHLPAPPPGRTLVLAAGKAATAMAEVAAARWRGPLSGLAVTRYGHVVPGIERYAAIEVIEAGHPVPDENSVRAARRALELAGELDEDDLALVLISGGGSALWCLPIPELSLEDKRRVTSNLLAAGASISELNAVRTVLSGIKGGRLAQAAAPARVETLIISDVVGDDPALIASGPTAVHREPAVRVREVLERYRIELPDPALQAMARASPHIRLPAGNSCRVVAASADALAAAAARARAAGCTVHRLGDAIEGEARGVARTHAAAVLEVAQGGRPAVVLSGGEVTVTVRDPEGVGGPNTEFLLALALELEGAAGVFAIACDTDGSDGIGDAAGALLTPDTLARAQAIGLDPVRALERNDSGRFFAALGDLVMTGPTQTNVSDFRAILVRPAS